MCVYGLLRRMGLSSLETLEYIKVLRPITYVHCGMQRFKDMGETSWEALGCIHDVCF